MDIRELCTLYSNAPVADFLSSAWKKGQVCEADNWQGSSVAVAFSSRLPRKGEMRLFVMNDEDEAMALWQDFVSLQGSDNVLYFPSGFRRAVKYGRSDSTATVLRTEVLGRIVSGGDGCTIVSYAEALAVKVASPEQIKKGSITLSCSMSISIEKITEQLLNMGFVRADYVYRPGQYSVRGSIVDIWSYSMENPVRIDFFGDEIDSIRIFDAESQLSCGKRHDVVVAASTANTDTHLVPLMSCLPEGSLVVFHNESFCRDLVGKVCAEGFCRQAYAEREALVETDEELPQLDASHMLCSLEEWDTGIVSMARFHLRSSCPDKSLRFSTSRQPLYPGDMAEWARHLETCRQQGYTIYIMFDDSSQCDRLQSILEGMNCSVPFIPVYGSLNWGFSDAELKVCVYTDSGIFGRYQRHAQPCSSARKASTAHMVKVMQSYEPGSYVVHIDHGVGRYEGLVRVENGGVKQEMMKIVYAGGDVVYVSIHQMGKVSLYRGRDAEPPRISRLGTGAWERMKDRAKKKVKDIARDLIRLYARRCKMEGHSFAPDNYLQHELEAAFPYEDTPDQIQATADVKHDMEARHPMDRLICGDVGFGKTEIALRAAFKAVVDGKQVAVLVPTTLLAMQHYKTFSARLEAFGVKVGCLTRALGVAASRRMCQELAEGKMEIVIGTQKLLGKEVVFKDLGLLVIDEEQKFGVAAKEKLRQMKAGVDTLTLSATPIPRTLQFSLMGARELSVLRTPPAGRLPIHTEVHLFGHEVLADAIGYEMSRGGQSFVVCSRIAFLPHVAELLRKYVPGVKVAVAHGQMPPAQMERTVMGFIENQYDVLLSTTIIENGIDIPNANTIVIVDAHHYGLSDLHQMRGRVGRSDRKAFCYLLAPPLSDLNNDARRRLEALEDFSELGSGFQIALQDLDIRGAGNLLGAEQSGFVADLGYEAYQKVLAEAMAELRNDEYSDLFPDTEIDASARQSVECFVAECTLDCDLPVFLPEDYVPGDAERMECYRHINQLETDEQVQLYVGQLQDRFGPLPPPAKELMRVPSLRRLGRRLGIERIVIRRKVMILYFVSNRQSAYYQGEVFGQVLAYMASHPMRGKVEETGGRLRMVMEHIGSIEDAVRVLEQMMPSR